MKPLQNIISNCNSDFKSHNGNNALESVHQVTIVVICPSNEGHELLSQSGLTTRYLGRYTLNALSASC